MLSRSFSTHMQQDLHGLTAMVTGAASGIGRGIAIALAERGADLLLHTRANRGGIERTQRGVETAGRNATTHFADLSNAADCEALVKAAWSAGPIDIWVHNAGADVLTGEAASEEFSNKLQHLWEVDIRGTILTCRAVGELMKHRGQGVILTIGWDQAATGMEGDSGQMFAATKGAVMAFTKSLAMTLAPEVRVNCLAPGWIKTKWGENAPAVWRERAIREALVGRWGEPQDVAAAAAFLTSPAATFITGQVINVNGGFAGSAPTTDVSGDA